MIPLPSPRRALRRVYSVRGGGGCSVADDVAEHGRVRDAIRDYWKLRYDLAKQIGVVSGVLLAVLVALFGVFYPCTRYTWLAVVTAVSLVGAATGALLGMMMTTRVVAELVEAEEDALLDHRDEGPAYPQDSASVARANRRYKWFRWVPVVALVIGVVCLLCFAVLNLGLTPHWPWWRRLFGQ
jgi:MFS family permease